MSEIPETPQPPPPGETRFELVFEASGVVGNGPGPDALPVPEQPQPEGDEDQ